MISFIRTSRAAFLLFLTAITLACVGFSPASAAAPQAYLSGADFRGGASSHYGDLKFGEKVNYVYARSAGPQSEMKAEVSLRPAAEPLFLHLRGRDDDAPEACSIEVRLNDTVLHQGPSGFSSAAWQTRTFEIPASALPSSSGDTPATATLTIRNVAPEGKSGMPPWFMVAAAAVGPRGVSLQPDITRNFYLELPREKRPFPEPLAEGAKPGFPWRGTKGWLWKPENYLATIPHLPKCGMNFLMNCYGSMFDIEHRNFGDPECNRWYEPLPAEKKKAYEEVVRAAQKQGLTFCFSMNPNLSSKRFVSMENPADVETLWQHYAWMQGLGVKWFNISLDDITQGIDAAGQARVVNEILGRLRKADPEAQMIFCPTYYWGDGTDEKARPYLEALAREIHPDVYLFWTGDAVVGSITRKGAETYKGIAKRRLFLWDNYPVNDGHPTMHLGPVAHRDPDLGEVVDGYMANPLHVQIQANLLPTYTCGDYAWNPRAYDPARSIGQAILHLEETEAGRTLLRDLVEAYAGMLVYSTPSTAFNAVRDQYHRIVTAPHSRQAAKAYLAGLESLAQRFESTFPNSYAPEKQTLRNDLVWIQKDLSDRYAPTN